MKSSNDPKSDISKKPFRVLSWGCGVQSTTLAVMSAIGDLPGLDLVITADTGWERQRTYEIRDLYVDWLHQRGIKVEIIINGNIRYLGAKEHVHIPFWTSNGGPLKRQCTREFKIRPIRRRVREILGYPPDRPPHPKPGAVEKWLGISLDEWHRMKSSRVAFEVNRYPLIEKRITRNDCIKYLQEHKLPVPPSSACVCCPYRSASAWVEMRDDGTSDFQDAIKFDETNRHNPLAKRGDTTADELFIYQYSPLQDADLEADSAKEKKASQPPLFICESGHCMI